MPEIQSDLSLFARCDVSDDAPFGWRPHSSSVQHVLLSLSALLQLLKK